MRVPQQYSNLPSAQFAVGYYWDVGVGTPQDVQHALKWYEKAAAQGNTDARDRLSVLAQPTGSALSRGEHDTLTERTLVRKRTLARQRSDAYSRAHPSPRAILEQDRPADLSPVPNMDRKREREQRARSPRPDAARVVDVVRRNSRFRADQRWRMGHPRQFPRRLPHPCRRSASPTRISSSSNRCTRQHFRHRHLQARLGRASLSARATRWWMLDAGPAASPRGASPSPPSGAQTREQTPPPLAGRGGGGVRYNTFAEMGIQGSKLEEKECVIM
ncbi:hypothetical protein DFH11DRAFT_1728659 [Phellopilus nigrolimitatus]|nr:hypothetical protein DFH11DRAFT_1728659 [Phellopilus nigrolimitatus]